MQSLNVSEMSYVELGLYLIPVKMVLSCQKQNSNVYHL